MQLGQAPACPPLFASELESLASPVPWPYCTSSKGSLSLSRKSQPAMSSTKPLWSASVPSLNAMIRSSGVMKPGGPERRGSLFTTFSTRESCA